LRSNYNYDLILRTGLAKVRLLKQKDMDGCGATAIINAIRLLDKRYSSDKYSSIKKKILSPYGFGSLDNDLVKFLRKNKYKTTLIHNPKLSTIKNFKNKGYSVIWAFRYPSSEYGHYTVIQSINPTDVITINNCSEATTVKDRSELYKMKTSYKMSIRSFKKLVASEDCSIICIRN
jgi:hypothetical protein